MKNNSALEFKKVRYRFPGSNTWVLKDLNLKIPKNKLWLIVGASGSGKSTFLHLARGFHKEYGGELKGRILIKGKELNDLDFYTINRMGIGWVGQNPALNLHQLTVKDEIQSSPIYYNLPWNECESITNKTMETMGISHLSLKSPNNISGGEQQRVAIGAALTMAKYSKDENCNILLLDEPDSFLDPKGKTDLLNILSKLKHEYTIIVVTHNIEHYAKLADGMTLIDNGRCIISGKLEQVLYDPAVQKYMGYPLFIRIAKKLQETGLLNSNPLRGEQIYKKIMNKPYQKRNHIQKSIKNKKEPAIEYSNLSYSYPNGKKALSNIFVSIPKGSITAIIGNNGSGKTTLAKTTMGLLKNYEGTIKILGKEAKKYPNKDITNLIAYTTQIPKDMFFMPTVLEECEIKPEFNKKNNYKFIAKNALKKVKLNAKGKNYVDELSGGQSRLLSIACTVLVSDPEIIILDEPEFGIDPKTWEALIDLFNDFKNKGKTIILLTHQLEITLFCDHVIVMHKEKIRGKGHPSEIYEDYELIRETNLVKPLLYPILKKAWKNNKTINNIEELLSILGL